MGYKHFELIDRLIYSSNSLIYLDISGILLDVDNFPTYYHKKERLGHKLYVNLLDTDETLFKTI